MWNDDDGTVFDEECPAFAAAFHPAGTLLASGDAHGRVTLWDAAAEEPRTVLHGHTRAIWSVAFSPDGRCLALWPALSA